MLLRFVQKTGRLKRYRIEMQAYRVQIQFRLDQTGKGDGDSKQKSAVT
jgi:hypothetical protein